MSFHEVRFPVALSFGATGGPERRTEIVSLANGFEERNTPWEHSRRRYDAGIGLRSLSDLEALVAFFEARRGQLFGFRWKDWSDWSSATNGAMPGFGDQSIGMGDGERTFFDIVKTYASGGATYSRPIRKPVAGSVRVGVEGSEVDTGWQVDVMTGRVTFDVPPPDGTEVSAGFAFDVPVRFDTDRLAVSIASFNAGEVPAIPVIEVRL